MPHVTFAVFFRRFTRLTDIFWNVYICTVTDSEPVHAFTSIIAVYELLDEMTVLPVTAYEVNEPS